MPKQAGAVELTSRRKEDSRVWRNPDGTRTAEFGRDWHYPDQNGDYQPVDLNFRQVSTTEWVAERSRVRIRAYRESGVNWIEITRRSSGKGIRYQIPLSATVQNDYVEFTGFGLTWRYYLTQRGVKLESSEVATSLGPKSYDFTAQLVGGATLAQVANATGGLDGDNFVIPRATAHCADGVERPLSAWSRSGSTVTFSMDDSAYPPEAYPYTVDPTTPFDIATGTDDTMVWKSSATYPPTGSVIHDTSNSPELYSIRRWTGTNFEIYNTCLKWDTSGLGSGIAVTGATLQLEVVLTQDGDSLSLTADGYVFDGTDADYSETALTSALSPVAVSSLPVTGTATLPLQNAASWVNPTGITGLRTHESGGQPAGGNYVIIASFENAAAQPRLIVDYVTFIPDETMRPTAVSGLTNLTGAVTDIDQDPDGTITDAGLVGTDPGPTSLANIYPNARVGATGQTAFLWSANSTNATDSSDSTFSTEATATTDPADYFSFAAGAFSAIPAGSTITGITATIKHRAGTANRLTPFLQLGTANGTLIGSEVNTTTNVAGGAGTLATTAGGITDTVTAFGAVPTLAQLQTSGSTGFGVRLRIVRSTTTLYDLYSIKVTVTYAQTINTQADVAMGDPVDTLDTGADTGQLNARFRKRGGGSDPQGRLEVRNAAGTLLGTPITDTAISNTSASGAIVNQTFDQSMILNKTDVVLRFVGTGASGGLAELVAVEWNAMTTPPAESVTTVVTQPFGYY